MILQGWKNKWKWSKLSKVFREWIKGFWHQSLEPSHPTQLHLHEQTQQTTQYITDLKYGDQIITYITINTLDHKIKWWANTDIWKI